MARIPKIYVGDQMVTRSKKRIFDAYGIDGCYVRLETSLKIEVLNWLKKSDPKDPENVNRAQSKSRRRESVAGAALFSVDNHVQEHSSDYLEKVSRPCAMKIEMEPVSASSFENTPHSMVSSSSVVSSKNGSSNQIICRNSNNIPIEGEKEKMVLNNFDPFRRLSNVPFALRGRPRAQSVTSRRPSLSTIFEHTFESELAAAAALVHDDEADDSSPVIVKPAGDVSNLAAAAALVHDDEADDSSPVIVNPAGDVTEAPHPDLAIVSKWVKRFERFEI